MTGLDGSCAEEEVECGLPQRLGMALAERVCVGSVPGL